MGCKVYRKLSSQRNASTRAFGNGNLFTWLNSQNYLFAKKSDMKESLTLSYGGMMKNGGIAGLPSALLSATASWEAQLTFERYYAVDLVSNRIPLLLTEFCCHYQYSAKVYSGSSPSAQQAKVICRTGYVVPLYLELDWDKTFVGSPLTETQLEDLCRLIQTVAKRFYSSLDSAEQDFSLFVMLADGTTTKSGERGYGVHLVFPHLRVDVYQVYWILQSVEEEMKRYCEGHGITRAPSIDTAVYKNGPPHLRVLGSSRPLPCTCNSAHNRLGALRCSLCDGHGWTASYRVYNLEMILKPDGQRDVETEAHFDISSSRIPEEECVARYARLLRLVSVRVFPTLANAEGGATAGVVAADQTRMQLTPGWFIPENAPLPSAVNACAQLSRKLLDHIPFELNSQFRSILVQQSHMEVDTVKYQDLYRTVEHCIRTEFVVRGKALWGDVQVISIRPAALSTAGRVESYVIFASSPSSSMRFCLNKGECHGHNHIYFTINGQGNRLNNSEHGIRQKCFSKKLPQSVNLRMRTAAAEANLIAADGKVESCEKFHSRARALPPHVMDILFPHLATIRRGQLATEQLKKLGARVPAEEASPYIHRIHLLNKRTRTQSSEERTPITIMPVQSIQDVNAMHGQGKRRRFQHLTHNQNLLDMAARIQASTAMETSQAVRVLRDSTQSVASTEDISGFLQRVSSRSGATSTTTLSTPASMPSIVVPASHPEPPPSRHRAALHRMTMGPSHSTRHMMMRTESMTSVDTNSLCWSVTGSQDEWSNQTASLDDSSQNAVDFSTSLSHTTCPST